ncbi:MAG: RimK family alpha-L-glutamate ligase [Deltaproteobacteria bacterium]|nr:RimK family alpha-L-glutamate ligase [Deltaproteobacteria bacterium]
MHIAILSNNPRSDSCARLKAACQVRGHKVRTLDPLHFAIFIDETGPGLLYKNKALGPLDAAIPRIGAQITFYGTAVVRQLERMGVLCLNPSRAIASSRDKLRALQILSRHAIPVPPTAIVKSSDAVLPAIEQLGGAPVVVKLIEGTQGVGVMLAESLRAARAILETLESAHQNVLIQRFISESAGTDIRAFVVGGRVVAAMRRVAGADEFRSNFHRGASVEPVQLCAEHEALAVRAAGVLGLRVAGVDLVESTQGPLVLEVNSSPGLVGIEGATGIDVGQAIVEQLEQTMDVPDIDILRQIVLQDGFGIVEIRIHEGSALNGVHLQDSVFGSLDVKVLSIQRERMRLTQPAPATELAAGDLLTCYGAAEDLQRLVQEHGRQRVVSPACARRRPPGRRRAAPGGGRAP